MAYRETDAVKVRKASRAQHLLRTAELIVREQGFAGLTMQALAERAEVGVGTLYRYFQNKGELATQVFNRATVREVQALRASMQEGASAAERLHNSVLQFANRAIAAPQLAWALIAEPVEPEVDAARLRYREIYASIYQQALDEGIARGEFPPQPTALAAAALVGAISEALVGPLAAPLIDEHLPKQLAEFVLRAVGKTHS